MTQSPNNLPSMRTEYSDEIINFSNWKISMSLNLDSVTCSVWVNTTKIKMSIKVSSYIQLPPTRCKLFFFKQGKCVWLGKFRFLGYDYVYFFLSFSVVNWIYRTIVGDHLGTKVVILGAVAVLIFLSAQRKALFDSCGFCMYSYPPCFQTSL